MNKQTLKYFNMKSIKIYILLSLITFVFSCSSDDRASNDNIENFKSQLCNNVVGPTAAYWDNAHGILPPLTQLPILKATSGQFIHSQHPYLGFPVPQGYTATEANNPQTSPLGVDVIRNDNAAVWRYVPLATYPTNFSANDVIATEINLMFDFYNSNGNFDLLCSETSSTSQSGINRVFTSRLIKFGNITGLVYVIVTSVQGLQPSVSSFTAAGPTNEYDALVMDIFLPLNFQLLVSDRGSLSDRDGDGVPDIFDKEPDNPNVQ